LSPMITGPNTTMTTTMTTTMILCSKICPGSCPPGQVHTARSAADAVQAGCRA
jgi:hypothetical protein